MREHPFRGSEVEHQHRRVALRVLLEQPRAAELRPCFQCDVTCTCGRASKTCGCLCSADCPHAAKMLSSDPERYPLEAGTVALVYEINALRVMQPYWSCEGHQNSDGQLVKLPTVMFYAQSPAYVDLLVQHLHALKFRRALNHDWQFVCLGIAANGHGCSSYALEPRGICDHMLGSHSPAKWTLLTQLQADLRVMAACFKEHIYAIARQELAKLGPDYAT